MAREAAKKRDFSLREFKGVNTRAARQVIGDDEFSWLEGVIPIGHGNMKTIPDISSILATPAGGKTIYWMGTYNLSNVDYLIAFMTDGSAYQVQVNNFSPTYAVTTVGAAGTFSGTTSRIAQWQNSQLLICDTSKGYFSWNGTTLTAYAGTIFSVTIVSGGVNFTYSPILTPSAGSAAFTNTLGLNLVTLGAAGTGYVVNDVLTLSGGTFTTAAQITVSSVGGGGAITGMNITNPGIYTVSPSQASGTNITNVVNNGSGLIRITDTTHGYSTGNTVFISGVTGTTEANGAWTITVIDANTFDLQNSAFVHTYISGGTAKLLGTSTVSVTGGHGTGATFTPNFSINSVTVTNMGSGYVSAPSITITGGGGSGASLTANLSQSTNGTTIEVYQGRVWIANNRTVVFSAPNSFTDFTSGSYGGSFIMTDNTMKSNITRLMASNNYLYIFGRDSINVISNVNVTPTTTSGGVTVQGSTTFTNTNITTPIGSDMPDGILPYYRAIMFPTSYGIYGLTGVTPTKASDNLDGIYNFILSNAFSCSLVSIDNIFCLCYLVTYADPLLGSNRQMYLLFFQGRWFFSSQSTSMKFITQGFFNDVPCGYATDGTNIYRLFQNSSTGISQKIQSKLWDMGSPTITKQVLKYGTEIFSSGSLGGLLTATIDTEYTSVPINLNLTNTATWVNNSFFVVSWVNNLNNIVQWTYPGYGFEKVDASGFGNYIGTTLTTSTANLTYIGFHLQFEERASWATPGS